MLKSLTDEQKINIELDEAVAEGQYCNLAIINHSPSEIVVDFHRFSFLFAAFLGLAPRHFVGRPVARAMAVFVFHC